MGEHLPYKQGVIGSSPIVSTTICESGSVVERCLAKANVASSNLVSRSIVAVGDNIKHPFERVKWVFYFC